MIRKIEENGFEPGKESGVAVMAFSAKWCPPCKVMNPIYEDAATRFTGMNFLKVEQEAVPEMFERFGVQSIPTYLILKDGKEVHRQVGALPASRFQAMLSQYA